MKTELQLFVERWSKGCGSEYCSGALNVVLGRGDIPCEVLFIGEAPGHSEDVNGIPFDGPAGEYMDEIIANGIRGRATYALTNLVCCIPKDESGQKTHSPDYDQIFQCSDRLREFVALVSPKLIVSVGKIAEDYLDTRMKTCLVKDRIKRIAILHPAYILRLPSGAHALTKRKCSLTIETALDEINVPMPPEPAPATYEMGGSSDPIPF